MPDATTYTDLALADAVRILAEHHHARPVRHISADEYDLLMVAADALDAQPGPDVEITDAAG